MTFNFDGATGNLLRRTGMSSLMETFQYDNLDRLTKVKHGLNVAQEIGYSTNGNIVSKTGVGTLYYDGQKPHAVSAADNTSGYIPSTTQQVTYTPFGKVETLTDGDYSMTFTYGPDEERWKTVLKKNGTVKRNVFYAGDYERVTENGTTRHFFYLDNGCIYVINDSLNTGRYYYAFTDHLGSVTRIYDDFGLSSYIAEYDAWGKQTVTKNTIHFQRGYTGHEMLPEFGLINMNGRLYDPVLGRFLSPDNFVQMPDFSQSFNRYSYCINNPLKYKDPSGELFGIDDAFLFFTLASGAIMGAAQAEMNGGNAWIGALKGFATSALSTIGTAGIGQVLGHTVGTFGTELLRAGLHGLNNGLISAINGNNIGTGFLTGAMSSFIGSGAQMAGFSSLGVIASSTITGSLTSALLGGNWFEGAMTGLNIGMYNHTWEKLSDGTYHCTLDEVVIIGHRHGSLKAVGSSLSISGNIAKFFAIASKRGLLGTNGKIYFSNSQTNHSFRGNQYVKIQPLQKYSMRLKKIATRLSYASYGIDACVAFTEDGNNFGRNLQRSLTISAGRAVGANVGAYLGGITGGTIGGLAGGSVSFGLGIIPVATIGEISGSMVGGFIGDAVGSWAGEVYFDYFY